MKTMFYIMRTIMYPVGALLVPCKVMDKDKYKKFAHGQMIVSNHLSWMDVAYQIFWIPGYKRILSKKENEGNKLQKWFVSNMGVIFVNREKPELSSMRDCINAIKNGETLSIFPEGTRNRVNRDLQEFQQGAALFAIKGEASVLPVVVHHKGKLFHRNYLGVGDPIDISDLFNKRVDEKALEEATERFREGISKTLQKLDVWVEEKGYKTERKRIRADKKKLKKQYAVAKKSAKLAKKKIKSV